MRDYFYYDTDPFNANYSRVEVTKEHFTGTADGKETRRHYKWDDTTKTLTELQEVFTNGTLVSKQETTSTPTQRIVKDYASATAPPLVTTTTGRDTVYPDGTISAKRDSTANGLRTILSYRGVASATQGEIISDGTISTEVYSQFGQVLENQVEEVQASVPTTTSHWKATEVDELGRVKRKIYFPAGTAPNITGAYETSSEYGVHGVVKETDRTGIPTHYAYDNLGRVVKTNRLGVTRETVYNGLTTSTHRYTEAVAPSGLTANSLATPANELSRQILDLHGNTLSNHTRTAKDGSLVATLMATTYASETNANLPAGIGKRTVETAPQTSSDSTAPQQTTDYFIDGQLYETYGDLQPHRRYSYTANTTGFLTDVSYVDAGTLKETESTQEDFLGRIFSTTYLGDADQNSQPDKEQYVYNTLGQLTQQIDADGVKNNRAYNTRGQQTINSLDLNSNDAIDYASDQVTQTETTVVTRPGGHVVFRTTTSVWKDDNSLTAQIIRLSDRSVDGLHTWLTEYPDDTHPLVTHTVTNLGTANDGDWTVTNTLPNGTSQIETYTDGLLEKTESFDVDSTLLYTITFGYDSQNRQTTTSDSRTTTVTRGYASPVTDIVTTFTDSSGRVTLQGFDARNRLVSADAPDAPDTLDADGAPLSNITTTSYYPHGDTKEVNGAQVYRRSYTYDYANRLKTLTSYGTQTAVTRWQYDANRGWLQQKRYDSPTDGQGTGPSYTYTAAGRLKARTWARLVNGVPLTTTYIYDSAGRLTLTDYSDTTPDVHITRYDRLGRVAEMNDASGAQTLTYTGRNRLDQIDYTSGLLTDTVLDYTRDSQNRLERLTVADATKALSDTQYRYDKAGRLGAVAGNGMQADYLYHPTRQQLQQLSISRGSAHMLYGRHRYDSLGRLEKISYHNGKFDAGFQPYSDFQYSYNALNQRTTATTTPNHTWNFGYNARGELTKAAQEQTTGVIYGGREMRYSFDGIGNRTQTTTSNQLRNYTPNALNQYNSITHNGKLYLTGEAPASPHVTVNGVVTTRQGDYFYREMTATNATSPVELSTSVTQGSTSDNGTMLVPAANVSPTHDLDGNLLSDGLWDYTWDAENRLVSMNTSQAALNASIPYQRVGYTYDAQSRRVERRAYGQPTGSPYQTTQYIYNGWNCVVERTTGNDTTTKSYTWGTDLSGTMQRAGGVGGLLWCYQREDLSIQLFCFDGNGNVTALVDGKTGEQTAAYEYGPFGELLRSTGAQAKNNRYRFSTKPQDATSKLYYYGYRFYDAEHGRWLNRDPIEEEGGTNLYGFVGNDGVHGIDVLGQHRLTPFNPVYTSARSAVRAGGQYALELSQANLESRRLIFDAQKIKHPQKFAGKSKPSILFEYGGIVCCEQKNGQATGKFYFAEATTGNRTGGISMLRIRKFSKCNNGDKFVGIYHNHPGLPNLSGIGAGEQFGGDAKTASDEGVIIGATGRIGNRIVTDIYNPRAGVGRQTNRFFHK